MTSGIPARAATPRDRDAALRLLARCTVAVGVAGAVGLAGLTYVSAATDPGHAATPADVTVPVDTTAPDSGGGSDTTAAPDANLQAPQQAPSSGSVFGGRGS
jgi:hypothetical protein